MKTIKQSEQIIRQVVRGICLLTVDQGYSSRLVTIEPRGSALMIIVILREKLISGSRTRLEALGWREEIGGIWRKVIPANLDFSVLVRGSMLGVSFPGSSASSRFKLVSEVTRERAKSAADKRRAERAKHLKILALRALNAEKSVIRVSRGNLTRAVQLLRLAGIDATA